MELIGAGIILIVLIVLIVVLRSKRKPQEDERIDARVCNNPDADILSIQDNDRRFTLAELKQAGADKYSWDETGCVFEINSDGSVTTIGRFDPAELNVDPVQEMFERLDNDGLIEMMPQIWSIYAANSQESEKDTFIVVHNDEIFSVASRPQTVEDINAGSLIPLSNDEVEADAALILSKITNGYLTLMPSNEKEYILSLGAKSCIERAFDNNIKVRISSPAVMGAFGIAIARTSNQSSEISFAFGDGEDYMCCNLFAEDGVCKVLNLLRSSVIQSGEKHATLQHIAKGCLAQSLISEKQISDYLLIDMLPYTVSLLLKKNGRVIKIYDCIDEPTSIPTRMEDKDINVDAGKILSLLIGSNELIGDLMAECNAPNGKIDVFIEIDPDMGVIINTLSNEENYKINIGELIG